MQTKQLEAHCTGFLVVSLLENDVDKHELQSKAYTVRLAKDLLETLDLLLTRKRTFI